MKSAMFHSQKRVGFPKQTNIYIYSNIDNLNILMQQIQAEQSCQIIKSIHPNNSQLITSPHTKINTHIHSHTLQSPSANTSSKLYGCCILILAIILIGLLVYDTILRSSISSVNSTDTQNVIANLDKKSLSLQLNTNPLSEKQKKIQQDIRRQIKQKTSEAISDHQQKYFQRQVQLNQREKRLAEKQKVLYQKLNSLDENIDQLPSSNTSPKAANTSISNTNSLKLYVQNLSLTFSQPTLGMKIPGKKFNDTEAINFHDYQVLLSEVLKPYNDTNCVMKRFGEKQDGGYVVCENLMNYSKALLNFGVQGGDNLGCEISSAFSIPNFLHDCKNLEKPTCSTNKNMSYFINTCIGGNSQKTNDNNYTSIEDIIKNRNLTDKHFSIKMNIEGAEWQSLRTLPIKYLDHIDQIFIEMHLVEPFYWGNVDILKALGEKFVSASLHMNNNACLNISLIEQKSRIFPSKAMEVLLVNKRVVLLNKNTRSYKLHPSFVPNNVQKIDCQIQE